MRSSSPAPESYQLGSSVAASHFIIWLRNSAFSGKSLTCRRGGAAFAALQSEHARFVKALQDKYGSIRKAPASEELVKDYTRAKTKYRSRKEFHKARMRSQLPKGVFSQTGPHNLSGKPRDARYHGSTNTRMISNVVFVCWRPQIWFFRERNGTRGPIPRTMCDI